MNGACGSKTLRASPQQNKEGTGHLALLTHEDHCITRWLRTDQTFLVFILSIPVKPYNEEATFFINSS